ncbi:thiopurine S-methyltransferase [Bordetella trematum]|uniref:thiopurine S-methyltransferase n=1 Tax=Bordetella trematum TaxID=123899 RepID=UPI000D8BC116|nr:thiopurine S-methyltransferase [Bordetella trematum]SPU50198.1 thiopurine S-methyltransferase [Bordetella trematum]VDH07935.1 Thiopurine S-methyltransferase [Bordetella trematum]
MEADFWLERWRAGQTGFHQARITPLLQKFWPGLALPEGSRVLVPLAGKSLDMRWLAETGHQVLGVELSPLAVEQFFDEQQWTPRRWQSAYGEHYAARGVEIICGDIFGVDRALLQNCVGVYDRAALVALPPAMRADYVRHVYGQLPDGYRGLLLTLAYDQALMDGPPFSVEQTEVERLYGAEAALIDQRGILDKEPRFAERGLTRLDTLVFRLGRPV